MVDNKSLPIGVFDSGVGGLTVAKEIMRNLPNEKIVYFADSARIPYGSKSKDTVLGFARQITTFLRTKEVKAIVIACNTASAFAFEELEKELDIPVVGVVLPGARAAARQTRNKKVGVIGTIGTVNSKLYARFIQNEDSEIEVYGKACPLFVPLVEESMATDSVTLTMAKRYLQHLMEMNIDTLVLGCTHYPLLKETIQSVVGENVSLVNPAYETVLVLKKVLEEQGLLSESKEKPFHEFYVSDAPESFNEAAKLILDLEIDNTKKINIESY